MRLSASLTFFFALAAAPLSWAQPAAEPLANEVVFFQEPNRAKAFEMLESGQMHVYAYGLEEPELKRRIESSQNVTYTLSYGNVWHLMLNPAGPVLKNGKLNPFAIAPLREALNWLFDRNYIAQELCFGLARPKYLPFNSAFPDYARLADVCRKLEIHYAFDLEKARTAIAKEMEALGATLRGGRWFYENAPVVLSFLIRTEDVRRRIGEYAANQLEAVGFTVDRQYKTAAEAGPIWIGSEPSDGQWHLYTGGWITQLIERDSGNNFNYFYTPKGRPDTLWQAYRPSARFAEVADRLARNDYQTWDERAALLTEALELSTKESTSIWLADLVNYHPLRKDVRLASDLAGGINGSFLWAHTARFTGGTPRAMRIGMPSLLTGPWNPIAGTNWVYDQMIIRGTSADPAVPDPFTGLFLPLRVKSAEVVAQEGTPMIKTLDWIDLKFVPTIDVPGDALIAWNGAEQRFATVQEKHPDGLKARTKGVLHFRDDLFKRRWHDGTPVTMADLMYQLIVSFERVNPASPIYDEAAVPTFESFAQYFRGFRVVEEDPLVFEYYSDQPFPDAEYYAFWAATLLHPSSANPSNMAPWHAIDIGVQAEASKRLAFSEDKAEKLKIEKMHYLDGPSLSILAEITRASETAGRIPYEKVMGRYVTTEQARERFGALRRWYEAKGHFWVGNGPFYIDSVHSLEKTVVCKRFDEFSTPDPRFLSYTEPHIAEVAVTGPSRVTIGAEAEFKINVTFKGAPYAAEDIDFVRFLVFNARGDVVMVADAVAGAHGEWIAKLPAEKTSELTPGSNRLEVAVAPKIVSLASFGSVRFVSLGAR